MTARLSAALAAAIAVSLAACSPKGEAPREAAAPDQAGGVTREGRDVIGRTYHYVRSNLDGSLAENVYVHRASADRIEVYKARSKCTNAAHVIADLDLANGFARRIGGGRLLPGAGREEFAVLTFDPDADRLDAKIELPGRAPLRASVEIDDGPWHLYDFDFASLTVMTPRIAPRTDFSFGLPLAIADPNRENIIEYLGRAEIIYRQDEERLGRPAHRYIVGGPAFGSFGGSLWLDAEEGHILDVETSIPNHLDYANFKLELEGVEDGGAPAWKRLLAAHFEGCDEKKTP